MQARHTLRQLCHSLSVTLMDCVRTDEEIGTETAIVLFYIVFLENFGIGKNQSTSITFHRTLDFAISRLICHTTSCRHSSCSLH